PPPPTSTLFPYTTLFRSELLTARCSSEGAAPSLNSLIAFAVGLKSLAANSANCGEELHPKIVRPWDRPHFNYLLFDGRSSSRLRSEEHTSELQSLAYLVC